MKNARSRQARSRRTSTPSVICLPGPKPPVTPKRSSASSPALQLPRVEEPHVLPDGGVATPSRQVRRQQMRMQRKAGSQGTMATAAPIANAPVTPAAEDGTVPLPRERSLALPRTRGWGMVVQWFRGLLPNRTTGRAQLDQAAVRQLQALRHDVAALQRTLDRMYDAAAR